MVRKDHPWKKIKRFLTQPIMWRRIGKFTPFGVVVIAMVIFYLWLGFDWLDFEFLKKRHDLIHAWSLVHPIQAALMFIMIYAVVVALSLPGGAVLSIFGGALFPQPLSTIYVVIGATLGASALFTAAKTAFGPFFRRRAKGKLTRLKKGFKKGEVSYLLFVRLVPLFPFWLVNLAAAFANIRSRTFLWTTALGIIPGSFVFTQAGRGVSSIFEHKTLSTHSVLNIHVWIALGALGIFALMPILVKWMRHD